MNTVVQQCVWPGVQSYIANYCVHWKTCLESKSGNHKKEHLHPYHLRDLELRNLVATLPWSIKSYRYFLVIVGLFSKYAEAIPMDV